MNKAIKFRGKRFDNGAWVYGFYVVIAGTHKIFTFTSNSPSGATWYDVDPKSVGQYTGCSDINGNEIFEGDIIQRDNCNEIVAEVWYDAGWSGYYGVGHYRVNGAIGWMLKQGYQIRVIGNVTDNPELLRND